jgi:hypothetical protein
MTPNEGTIEEEPGRGGNERTRLLTTARTTIKTPPGDHDRDGDGHGTVRASASASVTVDGKHQVSVRQKWWRMIMMRKREQMWVW